MNREEKNAMIEDLRESIAATPVFYLTDASELDAVQTSNLRRECFKSNIKLRVVKNTLLRKALEQIEGADYEPMYETLKGNTAIMFSEVGNAPAKLIEKFRKESDKPILKAAYIEEECYIGDDQLKSLTEIKSKEELIGEIITLLQSPATNLISALSSGGGTLSGVLENIGRKRIILINNTI